MSSCSTRRPAKASTPWATRADPLRGPAGLDFRERLLQVGDQVVGVLDPAREAHERVGDPEFAALRRRDVPEGHDGGHLDQRLGATEAGSDVRDAAGVHEAARAVEVSVDPLAERRASFSLEIPSEAGGLEIVTADVEVSGRVLKDWLEAMIEVASPTR